MAQVCQIQTRMGLATQANPLNESCRDYPYIVQILETNHTAQPLVKWAGGKRQLFTKIVGAFPEFSGTYIEPFFGGGAIFFGLSPRKAVINDVNKGLVNLYRTVQDKSPELLEACKAVEETYNVLSMEEKSAFYYKVRVRYNENAKEDVSAAVDFIFLNKAGFNGIYRENSSGAFNVPFGKREKLSLLNEGNLAAVKRSLHATEIHDLGFIKLFEKIKPEKGDLVYFDPPYVPLSPTASFTSYHESGFGRDEQMQLAKLFRDLAGDGVHVAMSNSSEVDQSLYAGFQIRPLSASRSISATASGRKPVVEMLVTSF